MQRKFIKEQSWLKLNTSSVVLIFALSTVLMNTFALLMWSSPEVVMEASLIPPVPDFQPHCRFGYRKENITEFDHECFSTSVLSKKIKTENCEAIQQELLLTARKRNVQNEVLSLLKSPTLIECETKKPEKRVTFHTWWDGPMENLTAILPLSYIVTQNRLYTNFILWVNFDPETTPMPHLSQVLPYIEVRHIDIPHELELSGLLEEHSKAKVEAEGTLQHFVRLSILHNYGGVWIDPNCILLRDMTPLLTLPEWGPHDIEPFHIPALYLK